MPGTIRKAAEVQVGGVLNGDTKVFLPGIPKARFATGTWIVRQSHSTLEEPYFSIVMIRMLKRIFGAQGRDRGRKSKCLEIRSASDYLLRSPLLTLKTMYRFRKSAEDVQGLPGEEIPT